MSLLKRILADKTNKPSAKATKKIAIESLGQEVGEVVESEVIESDIQDIDAAEKDIHNEETDGEAKEEKDATTGLGQPTDPQEEAVGTEALRLMKDLVDVIKANPSMEANSIFVNRALRQVDDLLGFRGKRLSYSYESAAQLEQALAKRIQQLSK